MSNDDRDMHDAGPGTHELGALVREVDPVPEVPRELMWRRIQALRGAAPDAARAALAGRRAAAGRGVLPLRPRWGRKAWQAAALLAATLAVGVGIGRMTGGDVPGPGAAVPATATADPTTSPYHAAAVTHLVSTQALLATFPAETGAGRSGDVAGWAGKLLLTTRMLMDSPAAEDPAMARLLEDLEIVLAQLAALPEGASEGVMQTEVDIINDGIDRNNVLPRIRVATAGRAAVEP